MQAKYYSNVLPLVVSERYRKIKAKRLAIQLIKCMFALSLASQIL